MLETTMRDDNCYANERILEFDYYKDYLSLLVPFFFSFSEKMEKPREIAAQIAGRGHPSIGLRNPKKILEVGRHRER